MRFLSRLIPRSIVSQITGLVAISMLLGIGLTGTVLFLFFREPDARDGVILSAAAIAKITQIVQSADTPDEANGILDVARRAGADVIRMPSGEFAAQSEDGPTSILSELIAYQLKTLWGIEARGANLPSGAGHGLVVRVDDRFVLLFPTPTWAGLWRFILKPTVLIIVTMIVFVLFLSMYAVRWIIAPLSALGAAAESFGRSPDEDRLVDRRGPREIGQLAGALNDMRTRIRALIDDRTRMLAAISHDLRTPLTRLRLRAERVDDPGLREGILHEVVRISDMLDETLEYLRPGIREERMSRVDLSSLLQTVCTEFGDVGHGVAYAGPPRLAWVCRPNALTRAVSNVVNNAVQHGSAVRVSLRAGEGGAAEIEVADDGPGIPPPLREKVFDPFFKGDDTRSVASGRGFGLGLSIARDVVRGHGGSIELLDHVPRGLLVRMSLPPGPAISLNIT
ncbi:ATP-binding protein [Inquilinus sp. Marseille-Q2685]|uniref:ATP-binding protein n=1 Tax=Inquilinus sp. Marseille-Q2685 TaxID=2866581 RepID=UPI001CE4364B|nr:ATP-binding protein [Inquilinus sp. Marseille-Q2685]